MRRNWSLGLGLLMGILVGPMAAIAHGPEATANAPILAIGPDALEQVVAVGGRIVGPTEAPFAVLAQVDERALLDLSHSKIWVVADGSWIAALCGVS